jgi:polysaccharide pyruvyl transferase WcaK-like protein
MERISPIRNLKELTADEIYFKPALQIENTGDLLINKAEIDLVRKYGHVILDDNDRPEWFMQQLSPGGQDIALSALSSESLYKTIFKRLKGQSTKSIYLLMPGGNTSRLGRQAAKSTFKNFLRLYRLKLAGCKIIRTGFSIGPFDTLNGWMESLNSRAFYHCSFRDQSSLKLANKYKFKDPKYAPDLAWAYEPALEDTISKGDYYVISLRSNTYGEIHDSSYLEPIKAKLLAVLRSVLSAERRIILSYQVKYDREACLEIYDHFKSEFPNIEVLDKKLLLKDAEDLYAGAKCVFSNRLHVLLLAMQTNTLAIPFINDVDNRKVTSIYNDNGLEDIMLYSDRDAAMQIDRLTSILGNEVDVMKRFRSLVDKNKALIIDNLNGVFSGK